MSSMAMMTAREYIAYCEGLQALAEAEHRREVAEHGPLMFIKMGELSAFVHEAHVPEALEELREAGFEPVVLGEFGKVGVRFVG
jgi:hypothetical protein